MIIIKLHPFAATSPVAWEAAPSLTAGGSTSEAGLYAPATAVLSVGSPRQAHCSSAFVFTAIVFFVFKRILVCMRARCLARLE